MEEELEGWVVVPREGEQGGSKVLVEGRSWEEQVEEEEGKEGVETTWSGQRWSKYV